MNDIVQVVVSLKCDENYDHTIFYFVYDYGEHNNNPFNGFLSMMTRVNPYQKKHSLTHTLSFWLL